MASRRQPRKTRRKASTKAAGPAKKQKVATSKQSTLSDMFGKAGPAASIALGNTCTIAAVNVNGFRAAVKKGVLEYLAEERPDLVIFTEMKCEEAEVDPAMAQLRKLGLAFPYRYHVASQGKKGYAGTAIWSRIKPLSVESGVGSGRDHEGRAIVVELPAAYVIGCYVPNSGEGLKFEEARKEWDKHMHATLESLQSKKPIIWSGDLNVAHRDFDVYDGETNKNRAKNAGFTPYERTAFGAMLHDLGLVDVYASRFPTKADPPAHYTYFSYRGGNRPKNRGWRLDYFCVSQELDKHVEDIAVRSTVEVSDHVPLVMKIATCAIVGDNNK